MHAVAIRFNGGEFVCQGCGDVLVGGVVHSCAGLQQFMAEDFDLPRDVRTPPPDAHPLVVREDFDPGDEDWS